MILRHLYLLSLLLAGNVVLSQNFEDSIWIDTKIYTEETCKDFGTRSFNLQECYYPNGNRKSVSTELFAPNNDLVPHGTWQYWYENGQLERLENYTYGKKAGSFVEFYPNGKLKTQGNYWITVTDTGITWETNYDTVVVVEDYMETTVTTSALYEHKKDGIWNYYKETGELSIKEIWAEGVLIAESDQFAKVIVYGDASLYMEPANPNPGCGFTYKLRDTLPDGIYIVLSDATIRDTIIKGRIINGVKTRKWSYHNKVEGVKYSVSYDDKGQKYGDIQYNYEDGSYVVGQFTSDNPYDVWKARFSAKTITAYINYLGSHTSKSNYGLLPGKYHKLIKARSMMYWYHDRTSTSSPADCFSDTNSINTKGFYLTAVEDDVNPAARIEIFWNRLHPDGSKAEEWIKVKPAAFLHTYMFTRWYANGKIEMQLLYDGDFELHGPCMYYTDTGVLKHTYYFEHGNLQKSVIWHK